MIDLTHPLHNNISVYPGTSQPKITDVSTIAKDGYAEKTLNIRSHAGTHIDAPCHIVPNTKTLDQFPIDHFIGEGMVIDCRNNNEISLELLKQYKGQLPQVDFVLFYAGWQEKWETPEYFEQYPVLTKEASDYLIQFDLTAIGFDSISADALGCTQLPNHNLFLSNEVLIIENLCNLDQLLDKSFELNCIPLNMVNSDASPVRVFARF